MCDMKFRLLRADEIECRISQISSGGRVSLLLYKDARVDQCILDETVGPMNWQRAHSRENANCIVSIWDDDKKMWVSKEDVGASPKRGDEATDQKGVASDSFKRACFNWGIGRELYTAPKIWVNATVTRNDKGRNECKDQFTVEQILYDESCRKIVALSIRNMTQNKRCFLYDIRPKTPAGGSAPAAR